MATANFFAPGFDQEVEQQNIDRQRKMAELLRQQSSQSQQGQMVSGHFIPVAGTQMLADAVGGWKAKREMTQADERQKALADAVRGRTSSEMGQFTDLLTGRPADVLPEGDQGPVRPAQAPDLNAAYQYAAKAQTPALQQFGVNGALTNAQEQAKLAQANQLRMQQTKLWQAVNGDSQAFIQAGGDPKLAKELAEAPNLGKEELINVNGQLVGKLSGKPVGSAIPKQVDAPNPASDLLIPDPNNPGKLIPNTQLVGIKEGLARKGAANVNTNVSVAAPENNYNKEISGGLAKDTLALVEQAKAAPQVVANARSIKAAIDGGAFTGTGANARLAVQKAAETLGIAEPGKAATTQQLMAGLGKLTLSGIKTSGLGGGNGFTDKDREFLNAAVSGQITDTPENLRRVADLSERAALATHQKGSKVLERWKQNPSLAPVAQDTELDPMPAVAPITPVAPTKRPPLSAFGK